jgi:hypothetical protein
VNCSAEQFTCLLGTGVSCSGFSDLLEAEFEDEKRMMCGIAFRYEEKLLRHLTQKHR